MSEVLNEETKEWAKNFIKWEINQKADNLEPKAFLAFSITLFLDKPSKTKICERFEKFGLKLLIFKWVCSTLY